MKREGKVGRNEPCPCGSGRKYKKCHWNRESAAPIPYHESAKELLRLRVGEQKCLHPMPGNAQCGGKVIQAPMRPHIRHKSSLMPQKHPDKAA